MMSKSLTVYGTVSVTAAIYSWNGHNVAPHSPAYSTILTAWSLIGGPNRSPLPKWRVLVGRKRTGISISMRDNVVGYIEKGNIYVPSYKRVINSRSLASLHDLHRAVITAPEPLPDVVFNLLPGDSTKDSAVWGLCRYMEDSITWLMPDFGFWLWPEPGVGSYSKVQLEAREMEEGPTMIYTWENKIPKLLWRGVISINAYERMQLMNTAKDQPWADVKEIVWKGPGLPPANLVSMNEVCQYKYIMYVEGHACSGSLRSQQNCRSVILAPSLNWTTHYQHLMKPNGTNQNYIEVTKDFSNLAGTIAWLEQNPEIAEYIADNSARTFRDRYISPAAGACYWRELIYSWAEVSEKPRIWEQEDGKWKRRGVPFEDVVLMGKVKWDIS
ncbi:glycosyl transferase family 90-domain-containing protein [Xylariales sp. PMI_506]|nr:glycosyl transferase family 90-domain-containing protein [Xylariales sp. PMI_506]